MTDICQFNLSLTSALIFPAKLSNGRQIPYHCDRWTRHGDAIDYRLMATKPLTPEIKNYPVYPSHVEELLFKMENDMLPKLFGHRSFRKGQREVLAKLLQFESCLAVFPTGQGKSLLYMLPSQMFEGVTIVVSPLLALMRDQVELMKRCGIKASKIDGSMEFDEIQSAMEDILNQSSKILFVSPERINNENFRKFLSKLSVSLFVVDEAHCISEWGHSFRPEYLRLSMFAKLSNAKVRLALTATATSRVANDILSQLEIPDENMIRLPSVRQNLQLQIVKLPKLNDFYERRSKTVLEILLNDDINGATVIYVNRQKLADRLGTVFLAQCL